MSDSAASPPPGTPSGTPPGTPVSPAHPEPVDELLEAGELEQARELLAQVPHSDERFLVVRVKLGLMDGSLPAGAAQQALIKLMRRDPEWPGAKVLYQLASSNAYRSRESSASHSHPPPPVRK